MRILVLTSTFPRWAGDAQPPFVFELSRRLAEHHEVLVLAPHCRGAAERERIAGLQVRRFRYAPAGLESLAYGGGILESLRQAPWRRLLIPCFLVGELFAAARAIREHDPDVVHAHWLIPQGGVALLARLFARRGRHPGVVCTSHGADLFALRGGLATLVKAWVVRRAAMLTVVSGAMQAEALRLGVRADKVRVMPMGVDATDRFTPSAEPRDRMQVLFVGRLVEKKGIAHLLDAWPIVRSRVSDAKLLIVGSGPLEPALRRRSRELGLDECVTFAGPVANAELPSFYRRAAVAVVPSVVARDGDQEGLGLVIAEALACECPVVASDLPAIRDVVQDGETGLLAEPGAAADIAEKILRLLNDVPLARSLAGQGRAKVLQRLDWSAVAQGYGALLSAAAAR